MMRDDDDYFPPIRHQKRSSSSGPPPWIGPVIGASIVSVFLVFIVIYIAVRKRPEPDRVDQPSAPVANNPLGPVLPKTRPGPLVPDRAPSVVPFVPPVRPAESALRPGSGETTPIGGAFARNDYREYRSDGALLTGFEVGYGKVFNTVIIAYLRPIWLTARGEEYGTAYGRSQTPMVVVKAREGYAVGGIAVAGGGALEGFALTFMRIGPKHLLVDDAYISDWYGEPTRRMRPESSKAGDGSFVIGLFGKRFDDRGGNKFDDGGAIATIGFSLWVKE